MKTVLSIGIPGAGKTTAIQSYISHSKGGVHYFSPDMHLMNELNQYVWTAERAAAAWRREYERFGDLLNRDPFGAQTAIWDATFSTRIQRCALVNIARGFGRVEAWFFATPLDVCIERNNTRSVDRRVPEDKLRLFFESLEVPTLDEGFHEVRRYSGLERIAA